MPTVLVYRDAVTPTSPFEQGVPLQQMQQLAEAVSAEDDWTGLTDPIARRKKQNRLSSRAYRRRKAGGREPPGRAERHGRPVDQQPQYMGQSQDDSSCIVMTCVSTYAYAANPENATMSHVRPKPSQFTTDVLPNDQYSVTNDHLLTVIHINVHHATLINMAILSPSFQCAARVSPPAVPGSVPSQLIPTSLQQRVPHPSWMDTFPLAAMRENWINALGIYDEDELLRDLVGSVYTNYKGGEYCGLIAWTQPWDISGWEASPGFVRKWGRLMKGCDELVTATNRWRATRYEEPLVARTA